MSDTAEDIKQDLQAQNLSLSQMLMQVNSAILATSQAQSYRIGTRSVTRATLGELRKLRTELMQEQAQLEGHTDFFANTSVAVFEGR